MARQLPPPLTMTDAAKARILALLADKPEAAGIRIGLKTAGCSGLTYTAELATEVRTTDIVVPLDGGQLLIDQKAELYLIGSVMDYLSTPTKSGFEFMNPNEAARCGCGESFIPRDDLDKSNQ